MTRTLRPAAAPRKRSHAGLGRSGAGARPRADQACVSEQQRHAADDERDARQLAPGRRLGQEPVGHGLRHQHLDEGEGAHVRGGGERRSR